MMKHRLVILLIFCALCSLAMTGRNRGQKDSGHKNSANPPAAATGKGSNDATELQIQSSALRIEFDRNLHSRVVALLGSSPKPLTLFSASETVTSAGHTWSDFALTSSHREAFSDAIGKGQRLLLTGQSSTGQSLTGKSADLRKNISVTIYADFPSIAVFDVEYSNQGAAPLKISSWTNNRYLLISPSTANGIQFWSYQSGSYEKRPNWIVPLRVGFKQENYLGMNASDYGGGTPSWMCGAKMWVSRSAISSQDRASYRSLFPCQMPITPAWRCTRSGIERSHRERVSTRCTRL